MAPALSVPRNADADLADFEEGEQAGKRPFGARADRICAFGGVPRKDFS